MRKIRQIMAWMLMIVLFCNQIPMQASAMEGHSVTNERRAEGSGEEQSALPETVSGSDAGTGNDGTPDVPAIGVESGGVPAVSGSDAGALLGARAGGSVEVTRLEWLKALTEVFQMSVDEDNYPDNYYSDIDASSEDYYDIMLATEFGLVDVEAGDPLRPDEAATREFAAHTLNLCLGYLPEEGGYTFSEASSVTYPDDIQTAINKGWLKLSGSSFLPEKGITAAEKAHMIAAAQAVLDSTRIDAGAGSQYQLAAGVIAVPEGTEAVLTDDNEITLYDCSVKIAAGDIFVVISGGIPIARRAVTVTDIDNKTIIKVESVETEEAFTSLDIQGSIEADLTQAQAIGDDVQLAYVVGGTPEQDYEDGITYYSLRDVEDREVTAVIATKTIDVPQGAGRSVSIGGDRITISCTISNPSLDTKIDGMNIYINLSADVKVSANVKLDDLYEFDLDQPFVRVPIGVAGYFAPTVEGKIGGKMFFTQKGNFSIGVQYNPKDGVRLSASFRKDKFTVSPEVELALGVKVAVGVDVVVVKAELYAKAGVKATVKKTVYTDNNLPKSCLHLSAHLYALVGGSVQVKFFGLKATFKQELKIYDENNSPVKVALHFDDGKPVSVCARDPKTGSSGSGTGSGSSGGYKYYTPINSQYAYSGINSGTLPSGEPFTFFEYSLDKNDQATITKYNGNVAALNIPETIDGYTVVGIGSGVFRNNTRIQLVTMPDSVTEIGTSAFRGCSNLSDVILSGNLEKLGGTVFENCESLTGITIPKSLKQSGFDVFNGAVNLKGITFEEGVTLIPDNLFSRSSIEEIAIPDTVTEIGEKAFMNCESLKSVRIPENVTKIGISAFYNCINLREIRIPDSVTEIGTSAFRGCSNLSDVILSGNLEKLGGTVFENCGSLTGIAIPKSLKQSGFDVFNGAVNLKGITFEEGVTLIPDNLFSRSSIEEIAIPDTVTEIGEKAFMNCESLKSVRIPESVTKIGISAFYNCINLREIRIPDSVTEIGTSAFRGCSNLSDVTLSGNLEKLGGTVFENCESLTGITIPKSLKQSGFDVFNGAVNLKGITFEEGVTLIPDNLFSRSSIEEIAIPDTVTEIGDQAFMNCESLKSVRIPESVTKIGISAFYNCINLGEISIPDSVVRMGTHVFDGCSSLEKVKLPKGRNEIPEAMFEDCTSLHSIELPESVTSIGKGAFQNCSSLTAIRIPDNVTSIGGYAFQNCGSLTDIRISDSVTSIGTYAFQNCDSLTAIRIPDSVTSIGNYCFAECELLKDVQLGTGLTKIGSYTFNLCPSLEKIVLPYRMDSIESNAFTNCTKLTQLTIPRTVKSIGSNAFSYPTRMTVYGVSGTYAETWAKSVKASFINQEKPATAVSLSETAVTVNKGSKATLILSVTPADFTDEVTWKSSNPSVAQVSDTGLVTAKGVGETVIQVNVGDKSASCRVTVVQPVTSISLNKTSYTMEAEAVYTLTATAKPTTAKDRTVTWSSSDENIATVDENGRVTALRKGTAVITATARDGSGVSKSCTVTVTNTLYHCTTVAALESPHNYESDCSDLWVYTLPGASRIAVTFDERTEMEDGFDYLYLYDASGKEIGKYTGKGLAGQTVTISGDTVKIRLVSDKSGSTWGFKVAKVEKKDSEEKAVTGVVKCPGTGTAPTAIQLIGADGKVAAQTSVGNSGTAYGLDGVAPGTYTLRVSRPNYVSRDYTVTVGSKPIELDAEIWLTGDVNGDGRINAMDKRVLYNHMAAPALTGYEFAVGDVNGDGKINAVDKRMIYNHISNTAPLW